MIIVNDLKPGITIEYEGGIYVVLDISHNKTAMRQMIVKAKSKNLRTGTISDLTFTGGDKVEQAHIEKREMQYLYDDGTNCIFMDNETYDMYELSEEQVGFNKYFIVEGMEASLMFFEGMLLAVSVPEKVELTVATCDPAIKGAPTNQTKDAVTETGLSIRVPQFIEQGEKIVVFTADGKYAGRA